MNAVSLDPHVGSGPSDAVPWDSPLPTSGTAIFYGSLSGADVPSVPYRPSSAYLIITHLYSDSYGGQTGG